MKNACLLLAVAAAAAAGSAGAQEVLKERGCLSCHAATEKKMGPSFKDIAAKHRDDSTAEDKLVAKLKLAKGHPKVNASEAELKTAIKQILATK